MSHYVVNDNGEQLSRENAYLAAAAFYFEPLHGFEIYTGPGFELEKNHNLFVYRFGLEYFAL